MKARNTEIKIVYKGKDISRDIAPFLVSFTFTDNSGSTADDISFTLEDREGLWLTDWPPSKGDKVQCSIIRNDGISESLPCGMYEVDQIDYSSPPRVMTIKAVSTAVSNKLKNERHSRAWENATIRQIAGDIAASNNLSLFYDAEDISITRREQIDRSDIEFLKDICSDYGLSVKANDGKLIVYDADDYEERASIADLSADDPKLISWKFSTKASNIYRKARVRYHDPANDEDYEAEHEDDSAEGTGRTLELHVYAASSGDAKELAQRGLYEANRKEISANLSMLGDLRFRAGSNINLSGFGVFSGKYTISKATHSVANGYVTSLEISQVKEAKKASKKRKAKAQSSPELYYTGDRYYSRE